MEWIRQQAGVKDIAEHMIQRKMALGRINNEPPDDKWTRKVIDCRFIPDVEL